MNEELRKEGREGGGFVILTCGYREPRPLFVSYFVSETKVLPIQHHPL